MISCKVGSRSAGTAPGTDPAPPDFSFSPPFPGLRGRGIFFYDKVRGVVLDFLTTACSGASIDVSNDCFLFFVLADLLRLERLCSAPRRELTGVLLPLAGTLTGTSSTSGVLGSGTAASSRGLLPFTGTLMGNSSTSGVSGRAGLGYSLRSGKTASSCDPEASTNPS